MEIYEEIIASLFADNMEKFFKENGELMRKVFHDSMGEMIVQIKKLLENDQMSDFIVIEEMIDLFQKNNIPLDFRHEFV